MQHYRAWLATRIPSALASALFAIIVMSLLGLYIAGGVGVVNLDTLHLPGGLDWLWAKFLEDPGTWSAMASGGFSMCLARVIIVSTKPLDKDRERMRWLEEKLGPVFVKLDPVVARFNSVTAWLGAFIAKLLNPILTWLGGIIAKLTRPILTWLGEIIAKLTRPVAKRLGAKRRASKAEQDEAQSAPPVDEEPQQHYRFLTRVLYGALTLPYLGFGLAMVSVWAGFKLAGFLLGVLYPYTAVDTVKTGVYAWLQQPPGAVLYALTRIFVFGRANKAEKEKAQAGLKDVLNKSPQLFGSFGPKLHLSPRFYLRWVPVILGCVLGLFTSYGVLLLLGYASGSSPAAWQVSSVVITSILAGVWIGWCGCWLSSLVVWSNTFGFPRSKDAWQGVNKTAFASMMGSTLGPLSQGVGFLMAALLIHGQSEKIHQGLYVFFGHVAGDLLSLIVVLAQARQMSHRKEQ